MASARLARLVAMNSGMKLDDRMTRLIDCMAAIPIGSPVCSRERITNPEKVK